MEIPEKLIQVGGTLLDSTQRRISFKHFVSNFLDELDAHWNEHGPNPKWFQSTSVCADKPFDNGQTPQLIPASSLRRLNRLMSPMTCNTMGLAKAVGEKWDQRYRLLDRTRHGRQCDRTIYHAQDVVNSSSFLTWTERNLSFCPKPNHWSSRWWGCRLCPRNSVKDGILWAEKTGWQITWDLIWKWKEMPRLWPSFLDFCDKRRRHDGWEYVRCF